MHIVYPNLRYDKGLRQPEAVINRNRHIVDWAVCVAAAGAEVSVVHRFNREAELTVDGVRHVFVDDPPTDARRLDERARWVAEAVADLDPDLVHMFQLGRALPAAQIRRVARGAAVLLHEHNDGIPTKALQRWKVRRTLRRMSALAFTAKDQAAAWQRAGVVPGSSRIVELPEGSSRFCVGKRGPARAETRLDGAPVCLWIGRLSHKNDPLTVVRGFKQALESLPDALLVMVYGESELFRPVQAWLAAYPDVSQRVVLHGEVSPEKLEPIFNSADVFAIGTSEDGSALAVVEALACGVSPVVTDIPAFQALTGQGAVGRLWPVGSPEAFAAALIEEGRSMTPELRSRNRAFFDANLSPAALGVRAIKAYEELAR
jgi:glycosyltransferase involved in cell wall biosynthesis